MLTVGMLPVCHTPTPSLKLGFCWCADYGYLGGIKGCSGVFQVASIKFFVGIHCGFTQFFNTTKCVTYLSDAHQVCLQGVTSFKYQRSFCLFLVKLFYHGSGREFHSAFTKILVRWRLWFLASNCW